MGFTLSSITKYKGRGNTRIPRLFKVLPFLILAALALLWGGASYFLGGRVLSVIDGDSLEVQISATQRQEVRLYGIDCPEGRQKGGEAATAYTRKRALFRSVQLEIMDTDRYGRAVAIVTLPDGALLNEELVREGHAWVYGAHCRDKRCKDWKKLERAAKKEQYGLWSEPNPMPPWKWRQKYNKNRNSPVR